MRLNELSYILEFTTLCIASLPVPSTFYCTALSSLYSLPADLYMYALCLCRAHYFSHVLFAEIYVIFIHVLFADSIVLCTSTHCRALFHGPVHLPEVYFILYLYTLQSSSIVLFSTWSGPCELKSNETIIIKFFSCFVLLAVLPSHPK